MLVFNASEDFMADVHYIEMSHSYIHSKKNKRRDHNKVINVSYERQLHPNVIRVKLHDLLLSYALLIWG